MRTIRNLVILIGLSIGIVTIAAPIIGCATVKTNPTLTEQEQARQIGAKIARGIRDTATVLRTLQDAEINLHNAPAASRTITDAEHVKIQQAFLLIFQQLDNALTRLQAVTSTADLKNTVAEVGKALTDLANALSVSNANASKHLRAAAEGVRLVFAVVESLIGTVPMMPVSYQTIDVADRYLEITFLMQPIVVGRLLSTSTAEGLR